MIRALIQIPSVGNASLIELIWTASAVLGLVVVVPSLFDTLHSRPAPARFDAGPDRVAAASLVRDYIRRETLRLGKLLILLAIGIYGDVTPPFVRPVTVSTVGILVTVGLFIVGIEAGAQSLLDRHTRIKIRHLLAERETP